MARRAVLCAAMLAAAGAMGADGGISPVQGSLAQAAPGATQITVALPAGAADGDALLFGLYIDARGDLPAAAGWIVLESQNNASAENRRWAIYFKVASAEPASYTLAWTKPAGPHGCAAVMGAFRGVDPTHPVVDYLGGFGNSAPAYPVSVPLGAEHVVIALADAFPDAGESWVPPVGANPVAQQEQSALFDIPGSSGTLPASFGLDGSPDMSYLMLESISLAPLGWDGGGIFSPPALDALPPDDGGGFAFRGLTTFESIRSLTHVFVPRPAGLAENDLAVLGFYVDLGGSTIQPPAGWSAAADESPLVGNFHGSWLLHRVTAGEPSAWRFDLQDDGFFGVTVTAAAWGGVVGTGAVTGAFGAGDPTSAAGVNVSPGSYVLLSPVTDRSPPITWLNPADTISLLGASRAGLFAASSPDGGSVGPFAFTGSGTSAWASAAIELIPRGVVSDGGRADGGVDAGSSADGGVAPDAGASPAASLKIGCDCSSAGGGTAWLLIAWLFALRAFSSRSRGNRSRTSDW